MHPSKFQPPGDTARPQLGMARRSGQSSREERETVVANPQVYLITPYRQTKTPQPSGAGFFVWPARKTGAS
jgi:hypothetical protein